jgi:acetyl esterase
MHPLFASTLPRALHTLTTYATLQPSLDVPYADRPGCTLDVLRPPGESGPLPVVVHVHGGAFRVFSKDTHGHAAARYARAGFAVVNVNYRLAPRHPFPAAVADVHDALAFVAARAGRFGLDLDRVVLTGESAGANLALGLWCSCVLDRDEAWARAVRGLGVRPRALHLAYGLLQVSDPARYGRDIPTPAVVRWRLPRITADYLNALEAPPYADPLRIVEALSEAPDRPHLLTLCGGRDPIAEDTRRLVTAAERLGIPTTAAWYPRAGHGFHLLPGRDAARAWTVALDHARAAVA